MAIEIVKVPDTGGADAVDVIEVCVAVGDVLEVEQSVVVLETDKVSMEIPTEIAGKVVSIKVNEGDQVSEGDVLIEVEAEGEAAVDKVAEEPQVEAAPVAAEAPVETTAPVASTAPAEIEVPIPDLGGADNVDVIEVCVSAGDEIAEGDSLIVLETDKASMEIPSPVSGTVVSIAINEGDKVSEGQALAVIKGVAEVDAVSAPAAPAPAVPEAAPKPEPAPQAQVPVAKAPDASKESGSGDAAYAGPAVRKLARQLGVNLAKISASGPRGRIMKNDIRGFVKQLISDVESGKLASGTGIPPIPEVDFSQFGEIDMEKMTKIKKVTAANMSRSWLNAPHVTQFDDADITEMEAFRKSMKGEAEKRGVKLTPMPFLIKAAASALVAEPSFNVSLHADGEHIVRKKYVHIGMAVDTPAGLVVPVIRDADKKGIWQLAEECAEMAAKARDGKLMPRDMQGGCFTISSLGALGGTGFTPIVNAPEVAIMGVSKAAIKPVWNGSEFEPRQMLPLTVSYDHRAINGADCGRFFTLLVAAIGDIRRLLL
ncbi:dihydrolipoyllysine-residue acetyltransferase [Maricurvus nonylphenolicus]|uniref:dihydrolipoyllysine-residue acetyltransferase n=1 Tax=Maricurvus nonylphenolicus TaxID=1008307 RepID=UPI0036F26E35